MTHLTFKKFHWGSTSLLGVILLLSLLLAGSTSPLMAGKSSSKGYLGVNIEDLSQQDLEELKITHGVRVTGVMEGEAAEKAGIKKGDVILFFNGEKIRNPGDLVDAVRDCKPDTQAKAKLLRDGKKKDVTVTLGKLKAKFHEFNLGDHKGYFLTSGKRGYLGIYLQSLNKDLGEYFGAKKGEGVLVLDVVEDSPAEKAGLKAGDVILQVKGKTVASPNDITKMISDLEKGDNVALQVLRHKKKQTINAEVGEKAGFHEFEFLEGLKGLENLDKNIHIKMPHIKIYKHDCGDENYEIIVKKKCKKEREEKIKEKQLQKKEEELKKKEKKLKKKMQEKESSYL